MSAYAKVLNLYRQVITKTIVLSLRHVRKETEIVSTLLDKGAYVDRSVMIE